MFLGDPKWRYRSLHRRIADHEFRAVLRSTDGRCADNENRAEKRQEITMPRSNKTVFARLVPYAEEVSKALRIEFLNGDVDEIQFQTFG